MRACMYDMRTMEVERSPIEPEAECSGLRASTRGRCRDDGLAGSEVRREAELRRLAPAYDEFNRGYKYERWVGRLLEQAEVAGLEGNRLLDVACGTGLSFTPMLDRGWQVTGLRPLAGDARGLRAGEGRRRRHPGRRGHARAAGARRAST